jgi:rhodanese-related sulfurtransferase
MSNTPANIAELQSKCHVFANLPERYLQELEAEGAVRTYHLDAGESLTLRPNAAKHEALMLLRGDANIRADGEVMSSSPAQDLHCRMIPLAGRSTEITARLPATVCRVAQDKLDYIISWSVMLSDLPAEDAAVHARLQQLRYPAIFMNLPFTNVVKAFQRMTARRVRAGEEFIRQGEQGDSFFIIESGRAEVWQQGPYDDEQKLVGTRVPGNHVGDEALVTGGTRNATVRMIEDGTLLVLSKDDFRELISQPMVNEVEIPVAQTLADRGYRFVDVRYEEEWEDGHIPGATLLPLTDIREQMGKLDRQGKYITYCLSGKRSAVAAMILKANGFDAVCMKDGLREWEGPTVTD